MKRILAFLLSLVLMVSLLAPASFAAGGEAAPELQSSDSPYTRIQVVHLLVDALNLGYDDDIMLDRFPDVSETADANAVATAVFYGLLSGSSEGYFHPTNQITRSDMAIILSRALNLTDDSSLQIADVGSDSWNIGSIRAVVNAGLMSLDAENCFYPHNSCIPGEVDLTKLTTFCDQIIANRTQHTATDLQWNLMRWDASDSETEMGAISFACKEEARYRVSIYRRDTSGNVCIGSTTVGSSYGDTYISFQPFDNYGDQFLSGTYFFAITPLDYNTRTPNSLAAVSPNWTYIRPAAQYSVSNPVWNSDMSVSWTDGAAGQAEEYRLQFQYVFPGETFKENQWQNSTYFRPGDGAVYPHDGELQKGDCQVYFRVCALSGDVTAVVPSGWSDWSAPFNYTKPSTTLSFSNLGWDSNSREMCWELNRNDLLNYYEVQLYYAKTDNRPANHMFRTRLYANEDFTLPQSVLRDYGEGYYWFAVRAVTADPTQAFSSEYVICETSYHYEGINNPATAPKDLVWNLYRNSAGTNSYEEIGTVSFGRKNTGTREEFRVDYFRKEASGDVKIGSQRTFMSDSNLYRSLNPFDDFADQFTTGIYYFTVTPLGDGVTTSEGTPVQSADWSYTRPGVQLDVSDPMWNANMSISWTDAVQNADALSYYELDFSHVPAGETLDSNHMRTYGTNYYPDSNDIPYPSELMLSECGSGNYYFRVRAKGEDVTEAIPSGWTEWCGPFAYTMPSAALTVSNLQWIGNTLSWTPNFDSTAPLLRYRICVYQNEADAASNSNNWRSSYLVDADTTSLILNSRDIERLGDGTWYFTVNTISFDPTQAKSNFGNAPYTQWTYTEPTNKLGVPTDLQWHVDYDWEWDNDTDSSYQVPFTRMGSISFKRPVDENGEFFDQAHYDILYYCITADGTHLEIDASGRGINSTSTDTHVSDQSFIYGDHPSGTYYFKVRCSADGNNYASSNWASSLDYPNGTFVYVQPSTRLPAPTGLYWDDETYINWETQDPDIAAVWSPVEHAVYYNTDFYYAVTETGRKNGSMGSRDIQQWDEKPYDTLWDGIISEYGKNWYFFQVQAIPADITQYRISEPSVFSPGYYMGKPADQVNSALDAALDNVTNNNSSAADIQNAVADLDHLDEVMAAEASSGSKETMNKLEQLEEAVKTELNVQTTVTSNNSSIDASKVTASNMALNVDIASATEAQQTTVTLNISTANGENVTPPSNLIDTQKNNTVVFSMDIEGAKDADGNDENGRQLTIPVQITLPIPADINRSFLVILHQKSDGTWEELRLPHIHQKNGQWYATFNVYSFSNYAMGEQTLTATADGNTVTIEAHLPTCGADTQYMCAVYSQDGQMLGMGILQPQANTPLTIELAQAVPADAYLKVFSPDAGAGWAVHSEAATVDITN